MQTSAMKDRKRMPVAGIFSLIVGLTWLLVSFAFISIDLWKWLLAFGGGAFLIAGGARLIWPKKKKNTGQSQHS